MKRAALAARPENHEQRNANGERAEQQQLRTPGDAANNFSGGVLAVSGYGMVGLGIRKHTSSASHDLRGVGARWQNLDGLASAELWHRDKMLAFFRRVLENSIGRNENADVFDKPERFITNEEVANSRCVGHTIIFSS